MVDVLAPRRLFVRAIPTFRVPLEKLRSAYWHPTFPGRGPRPCHNPIRSVGGQCWRRSRPGSCRRWRSCRVLFLDFPVSSQRRSAPRLGIMLTVTHSRTDRYESLMCVRYIVIADVEDPRDGFVSGSTCKCQRPLLALEGSQGTHARTFLRSSRIFFSQHDQMSCQSAGGLLESSET